MNKKVIAFLMLIFASAGAVDAGYLTAYHYKTLRLPCTITQGCDTVLQSKYSEIFGVPIALFGVLYYLAVILFIIIFLKIPERREESRGYLLYLTFSGFLITLWLTYLQIFVIRSFCQYCLLSGIITAILFIFSIFLSKKNYGNTIPRTPR